MCVEYSGTGAVITSPPRVARQSDDNEQSACLAAATDRNASRVVKTVNNPSNAGIDFDQSAAPSPCSTWIAFAAIRRASSRVGSLVHHSLH
jgi:hypothetical protein